MGFLKRMLGVATADEARDAMWATIADEAERQKKAGTIDPAEAIIVMMEVRLRTSGPSNRRLAFWHVAPFLLMPKGRAAFDAVIEYVVCVEGLEENEQKMGWVAENLNKVIGDGSSLRGPMTGCPDVTKMAWFHLLTPDNQSIVRNVCK